MRYSVIVPYFRTPEVTRLCLYAIYRFARGEPEVIVVDNAPASPESAMLREFPAARIIDNAGAPLGSDGNFHALDRGLACASHDLVALFHSDTLLLRHAWDVELFGRLSSHGLAAIGTFERESNPFESLPNRLRTRWRHLRHRRHPSSVTPGKLMVHFLLTRRSTLAACGFSFARDRDITVAHLLSTGRPVELLSALETGRVLWHTSNVTSVLTGQMGDPQVVERYREKRRQLLCNPRVREAFGPVLPRE